MEKAVVTSLRSKNDAVSAVTLSEWIQEHHSEDELRSIFLNMDRALKYIHDHGYCIDVFYPTEINVLNNEDDYIQFRKLVELSKDYDMAKEMMKEDIFRSSLIQIGIYSNSLRYLTPEFLRDNFDSFAEFIPNDDVPYYRGVVQRGASVYFCEYAQEKSRRDLEDLEKQLGDIDNNNSVGSVTNTNEDITNKKINDLIYRQISGINENAAFLNVLALPLITAVIIAVVMIIMLIINYIG